MRNATWALLVVVALAGCDSPRSGSGATSRSVPRTGERKSLATPSPSPSPSPALACADAWLKAHNLNELGDPPGTMYAGGTPLFDEAASKRRDRLELLREKHPDLRAACP